MTRRMIQNIVEDLVMDVTSFRQGQIVSLVLDEMLDNVKEHALVNKVYQEVLDSGPNSMSKLEEKVGNRQAVKSLVEDLVGVVMDMVAVKARRSLHERRRLE